MAMPAHGSSGPADTAQPIDANAFIAFEADGWQRQAPTYGDFLGQITRQFVSALLDAAGVVSGLKVLDLATGPGYAAGMAAQRGAAVIGVDFAEAMVQLAQRGHPDLDFREPDAEALPFSRSRSSWPEVVGRFNPRLARASALRLWADDLPARWWASERRAP
jgi:SAM-dependent methyltransferase